VKKTYKDPAFMEQTLWDGGADGKQVKTQNISDGIK
jgi:hypothetical protein